MLRKLFLAATAAVSFFASTAQDSTKTLTVSGSIDGYYRYNFAGKTNNFTSFTNSQSSFELGMASLRADATALSGKVGATVDLGFGRRAEEFSYNELEKFFLNKTEGNYILESIPNDNFSIEKDFFEKKLNEISMRGYIYDGYFIDIGIPEDYKKAQHDFKTFKY